MKYMLLIHIAEDAMSESERDQCYKDSAGLTRELHQAGQYLSANPLQSIATATSVRVREGKRFVTDGPFAETREQLGGYFLVDVKDKDAAIDIASRIPGARKGSVEIRSIVELDGLPKPDRAAESKQGIKYLLLSYDDEKHWENVGKAAHLDAMNEAVKLTHQLNDKGQYLLAAPLEPGKTATTVRVRDGKRLVTDGPFAETREVLGGFYLINVGHLDEAIDVAGKHPGVRVGTVEIRPVLAIQGLPKAS